MSDNAKLRVDFARVLREFGRGCSCSEGGNPADCSGCLDAAVNALVRATKGELKMPHSTEPILHHRGTVSGRFSSKGPSYKAPPRHDRYPTQKPPVTVVNVEGAHIEWGKVDWALFRQLFEEAPGQRPQPLLWPPDYGITRTQKEAIEMPKVHHRKAGKDYPNQGIKKGDMYYTARIRMQRGGRVVRSLNPLRPSQLTDSPYKGAYFAMQEAWSDAAPQDGPAIRAAAEAVREIGEAAGESFENMPEGLQQGDTGQMLENRMSECESKAGELEGLADEYDALEEPTEPDDVEEPGYPEDESPDDNDEWLAFNQYQDDLSDYEEALAEYESERERIIEEAEGLIEDMPE